MIGIKKQATITTCCAEQLLLVLDASNQQKICLLWADLAHHHSNQPLQFALNATVHGKLQWPADVVDAILVLATGGCIKVKIHGGKKGRLVINYSRIRGNYTVGFILPRMTQLDVEMLPKEWKKVVGTPYFVFVLVLDSSIKLSVCTTSSRFND